MLPFFWPLLSDAKSYWLKDRCLVTIWSTEVTDCLEGDMGIRHSLSGLTDAELIEAIEHMELCLEPIWEPEGVEGGVARHRELPPLTSYEAASSITCSAASGSRSGLVVTLPNFCMTSSIEANSDNIPSSSSIIGFKEATKWQYLNEKKKKMKKNKNVLLLGFFRKKSFFYVSP